MKAASACVNSVCHSGEAHVSDEMKGLFSSCHPRTASESRSSNAGSGSASLPHRAGSLCRELRPGKLVSNRRKKSKAPYSRPPKQYQKNLVAIDFQGEDQMEQVTVLPDYDKIYDGCMRYDTDMSETEIREEISRLLKQKGSVTHDMSGVQPDSFDFVRCSNHKVRCIYRDVPFDCSGINQVYRNGSIYVRFKVSLALPLPVS